jgi:hypothetical protein
MCQKLHLKKICVLIIYKKIRIWFSPFSRFLNSKKYQILRTYINKHLNIESKRNKHFIKLIIHNEVLKLQNCEIVFCDCIFGVPVAWKRPKRMLVIGIVIVLDMQPYLELGRIKGFVSFLHKLFQWKCLCSFYMKNVLE